MVQLRLSVSNRHGQKGTPLAVTSDMLEVIPSPNDVSVLSPQALQPLCCPLFPPIDRAPATHHSLRSRS